MGRVVIERSTERSRAAEAGLKKGARRATTLLQLDDLNDQLNPRKAMSNAASALVEVLADQGGCSVMEAMQLAYDTTLLELFDGRPTWRQFHLQQIRDMQEQPVSISRMWFNTYAEVKNAMYIVQFESSFEVHRYEVSSLHKLTEAMTGRPLEVNSLTIGDHVRHPTRGEGTLIEITGTGDRNLMHAQQLLEAIDELLDDDGETMARFKGKEERLFRYTDYGGDRVVGFPEYLAICMQLVEHGPDVVLMHADTNSKSHTTRVLARWESKNNVNDKMTLTESECFKEVFILHCDAGNDRVFMIPFKKHREEAKHATEAEAYQHRELLQQQLSMSAMSGATRSMLKELSKVYTTVSLLSCQVRSPHTFTTSVTMAIPKTVYETTLHRDNMEWMALFSAVAGPKGYINLPDFVEFCIRLSTKGRAFLEAMDESHSVMVLQGSG